MPKYEKDTGVLANMAKTILRQHEIYAPVLDCKIDFLFAYGDQDDDGNITGDALKHHGVKALGVCKVVSLKDRAKGMGDAEIIMDGDWWPTATEDERVALLDHELFHIKVTGKTDDLGRPKIKMRQHDWDFGWFDEIARRHGTASGEVQMARSIMEKSGQWYWD